MRLCYHPETDSLYIELSDKPGVNSQEIKPGIVLDLDEDGNLVGLDIDRASKKVDLSGFAVDIQGRSYAGRLGDDNRKLMHDMRTVAEGMLSDLECLRSQRDQVCARCAYLVFFVRMFRIFRAFITLIERGLGPEADLLVRPFFDTLIDWLYIESDPETLGERYVRYEAAARLQRIRDHGNDVEAQRYVDMHGDVAKEFCDLYCDGKDRVPREWINLSMENKASRVGLENYYPIFRDLSNKLHNSPWALGEYIDTSDPEALALRAEPHFAGLEQAIEFVCLSFLMALQKANEHLGLGSRSAIEELGEQIKQYIEANGHGDYLGRQAG